jgi:uncharacterized protein (UPF0548 family)
MLCISKPGRKAIDAFIASQHGLKFTYDEVGGTRGQAPTGYNVDHNRVQVGRGAEDFERAKDAIRKWKMFEMPQVELCWPEARIETGTTVAVMVSHGVFWSLSACRIAYVLEERGTVEKYGFAYGTLPEHGVAGEERFSVEFHSRDQTVWYDMYAFSRPNLLARLAYPYTRAVQRRFARGAKEAMRRAVERF